MHKKYFCSILFCLLLLISSPFLLAADKTPAAEILIDKITVDYTNSTPQITRKRKIKVLTSQGAYQFRNINLKYNNHREKVAAIYAQIIKPDGKTIKLKSFPRAKPQKKLGIYTTAPHLLRFYTDLYPDIKTKLIVFEPELKPGDTIVYKYTTKIKNPVIKGEFWLSKKFKDFYPLKHSSLTLKIPENKKINYNHQNTNLNPEISQTKNIKKYSWIKEDIPPIKKEAAMPPVEDITPKVIISSLNTWTEFTNWYNDLLTDKYKSTPPLKKKVNQLTSNLSSKEEKIKAIYQYVTKSINQVKQHSIGSGYYIPRPAADIFKTKEADSNDKITLLITMLKEINVKAQPVLLNTASNPNYKIVNPNLFNHIIAYLPEENIYLDPSISGIKYGRIPFIYQGKKALLPKENRFIKTETVPAKTNQENITQQINITKTGRVNIKLNLTTNGYYDTKNKLQYQTANPHRRIEVILKKIMNEIFNQPKIKDVTMNGVDKLNKPFNLKIDKLIVNNYAHQEHNKLKFNPFKFPINIPPHLAKITRLIKYRQGNFPEANRHYPVEIIKINLNRFLQITLPEGYCIKSLPEDIEINNELAQLAVNYKKDGNKINIHFKLILKQKQISKQQFKLARDLFNQLAELKEIEIAAQPK